MTTTHQTQINIETLGIMRYAHALAIMNKIHEAVARGSADETILVVEHPPVVTMGKRNLQDDLLLTPEHLAQHGVDFALIDRGGSATIHEPGQAVVYPIVRLHPTFLTVRRLVWILEESMIRLAAEFDVEAKRDPINPGIYVGSNKLGALGIRVQNRVSRHGLAMNISNSLDTFRHIVPCGLHTRGVTSLSRELQNSSKNLGREDTLSCGMRLAKIIINLISASH